jgi:hypothetical protein
MPEVANQVCDGVFITSAAVALKNRYGLGGPGDVFGLIGHASTNTSRLPTRLTEIKCLESALAIHKSYSEFGGQSPNPRVSGEENEVMPWTSNR